MLASARTARLPSLRTRTGSAILVAVSLVMLILVPGVQAHGKTEELFEEAEIALIPYAGNPPVVVDGRLAPEEYGEYGRWVDADSGFVANFQRDDDSLYVSLANPGGGWMAVGFTSNIEEGMGLAVVGVLNGTLQAVDRVAQEISDEMAFASPPPPADERFLAFAALLEEGKVTAEMQLALEAPLWMLEPGELLPLVIAFNETSAAMPTGVEGSEVHFLQAFLFRPQDDPAQIRELLEANISPIPTVVAVAVLSIGVLAIFLTFVGRRGRD